MRKVRAFLFQHWRVLALVLIFVIFFYFILPISLPLILALITALLIEPVVKRLSKGLNLSRSKSSIVVFSLFTLAFLGVIVFLSFKITTQTFAFVNDLPHFLSQLNSFYNDLESKVKYYLEYFPPEFVKGITSSLDDSVTSLIEFLKNKLTIENVTSVFSKVPQFLVNLMVYFIALFLFMLELPSIIEKGNGLLKKETREKVMHFHGAVSKVFFGYIKAQFKISLLVLAVSFVWLLFVNPKIALLMSLIIWLIDLLPIVGSIIILGPWSIYAFSVGMTSLGVKLTLLAIIILVIRRVLEPKLMGNSIGLSPLITLISMYLGFKIIGLLGFIVGPLIVILVVSLYETGILKSDIKF